MTPEREAEIRAFAATFGHNTMLRDLLAALDAERERADAEDASAEAWRERALAAEAALDAERAAHKETQRRLDATGNPYGSMMDSLENYDAVLELELAEKMIASLRAEALADTLRTNAERERLVRERDEARKAYMDLMAERNQLHAERDAAIEHADGRSCMVCDRLTVERDDAQAQLVALRAAASFCGEPMQCAACGWRGTAGSTWPTRHGGAYGRCPVCSQTCGAYPEHPLASALAASPADLTAQVRARYRGEALREAADYVVCGVECSRGCLACIRSRGLRGLADESEKGGTP